MNLSILNSDRMADVLRGELQRLMARINRVWGVDHDPQTGAHRFGTTQSTVGAAGSASALPATPSRYAQVTYVDANGNTQTGVIALYDAS